MITGNEPAIPIRKADLNNGGFIYSDGLTIRQYFAAMNMAAYIASGKQLSIRSELLAEWSVKDANALITELNKEK